MTDEPWPGQKVETPAGAAGAKADEWPGEKVTKDAAAAPKEEKPQNIWQYGKATAKNIPKSALRAAESIAEPFLHPIDTAENFADLSKGIAQYMGFIEGTDFEKYPDAVGKFFVERYGGWDRLKETIKNDPVGFAMDASVVFSGGGTALARVPGAVGEVGKVVSQVGRAMDPLTVAGKTAKGIASGGGQVASKLIGGVGTFTGEKPIQTAFQSGKEGGKARDVFLANLRQQAPKEAIVLDARNAVSNIRRERGKQYRQGMAGVARDPTILSFDELDKAFVDMDKVATFTGRSGGGPAQIIEPSTEAIRKSIKEEVASWKNLQASEFWTPEGFDALKRKIGSIRDATEAGSPDRLVADQAYNAVKDTIIKQAPEYAKVMHAYDAATDLIKQMDKELSVNPRAGIGTTLRKLQSVLRDNVNTSYGYRAELADVLVNAGAPHLLEAIAGQAMESWSPRGLGKLAAGAEAAFAFYNHDLSDFIRAAVLLGLSSPRLMGETANALGTASRYGGKTPLRNVGEAAFQAGRLPITDEAMGASQAPQPLSDTPQVPMR